MPGFSAAAPKLHQAQTNTQQANGAQIFCITSHDPGRAVYKKGIIGHGGCAATLDSRASRTMTTLIPSSQAVGEFSLRENRKGHGGYAATLDPRATPEDDGGEGVPIAWKHCRRCEQPPIAWKHCRRCEQPPIAWKHCRRCEQPPIAWKHCRRCEQPPIAWKHCRRWEQPPIAWNDGKNWIPGVRSTLEKGRPMALS